MTDHTWAQGAADCAVARSHQHPFGSERQVTEFETFRDPWNWGASPGL
jgi:hypothetical protein